VAGRGKRALVKNRWPRKKGGSKKETSKKRKELTLEQKKGRASFQFSAK